MVLLLQKIQAVMYLEVYFSDMLYSPLDAGTFEVNTEMGPEPADLYSQTL